MAKMMTVGVPVVISCAEPKPLNGFPAGRVRFKMRPMRAVVAYVKTETSIRAFTVHDNGTEWVPAFEIGRNLHTPDAKTMICTKGAATGMTQAPVEWRQS
jgi:hypothetical protein